jgi:hypothetical protein
VPQEAATLTRPQLANITYGTRLTGTQLDATASVLGTFTYSPPAGTVLKVDPQLLTANTALTTAASVTGRTISDAATLTEGYSPAGTITFSLYGPGGTGCGTLDATYYATPSSNGTYTSAPSSVTAPGTYTWQVSYSGDSDNYPAQEGCGLPSETVTVAKATPTLMSTPSGGSPTPHPTAYRLRPGMPWEW